VKKNVYISALVGVIKVSSIFFEQIIVHHQKVISVHAAYNNLPSIHGCLTGKTVGVEHLIAPFYRLDTNGCLVNYYMLRVQK